MKVNVPWMDGYSAVSWWSTFDGALEAGAAAAPLQHSRGAPALS
jgi:hypothetical protein